VIWEYCCVRFDSICYHETIGSLNLTNSTAARRPRAIDWMRRKENWHLNAGLHSASFCWLLALSEDFTDLANDELHIAIRLVILTISKRTSALPLHSNSFHSSFFDWYSRHTSSCSILSSMLLGWISSKSVAFCLSTLRPLESKLGSACLPFVDNFSCAPRSCLRMRKMTPIRENNK
jgi:hypothetical protein